MLSVMSYIGSIESLMAGMGMQEVLEKVFGSVTNMLTGKIYPQCVCTIRLFVELLRECIS